MTGFGRAQGEVSGLNWTWEIRAVNGKGFDVRIRLPQGYERFEVPFRKLIADKVSRGNLQANLSIESGPASKAPSLNQQALSTILKVISEIDKKIATTPSSAADILALRGILDVADQDIDEEIEEELAGALTTGLNAALVQLNEHRATEGGALAPVLQGHLDRIARLTIDAESDPGRTAHAIKSRLKEQLDRILEESNSFDPDRLLQEVALLATKSDIREELDRLHAHVEAARGLIAAGSPVGRKLEFLAQEFNRESNTLCSKSNAVSLTAIGLEMKVVIDQFREQILNVE